MAGCHPGGNKPLFGILITKIYNELMENKHTYQCMFTTRVYIWQFVNRARALTKLDVAQQGWYRGGCPVGLPHIRRRSLPWEIVAWKHFLCYWPFARGIHRSPMNSQWVNSVLLDVRPEMIHNVSLMYDRRSSGICLMYDKCSGGICLMYTNHFVHKVEFSYIGWSGVHPLWNSSHKGL